MAPGSPLSRWLANLPSNEGKKVVISDTDHYASTADALWAWKSFLSGHHPILRDYGIIAGVNPPDPSAGAPGVPPYAAFEAARFAMGDSLRYVEKINLIAMEPREDLTSTGFALVNPGQEYLILQPSETSDPFTVKLEPGSYTVEWFSVNSRETRSATGVTIDNVGDSSLMAPFAESGPAVLYLKRSEG